MSGHLISDNPDGTRWCSCGERFPNATAALDHALPLNVELLAAQVTANPNSTPEQIERVNSLVARTQLHLP